MSLDGHVLCQRMLSGPDWALTAGVATLAAAVAPAASRNLRRLAVLESGFLLIRRPSLGSGPCAAPTAAHLSLLTLAEAPYSAELSIVLLGYHRFTSPWASQKVPKRPILRDNAGRMPFNFRRTFAAR